MTALEIYAVGVPLLALALMGSVSFVLIRRDVVAFNSFATHRDGSSATPTSATPTTATENVATVFQPVMAARKSFVDAARQAARLATARPNARSESVLERAALSAVPAPPTASQPDLPSEQHQQRMEPHERALASLDAPLTLHRLAAPKPDTAEALSAPQGVTLFKSGVIDGMVYSLYSDGAIETVMPNGVVRFDSIEDLRRYLARSD